MVLGATAEDKVNFVVVVPQEEVKRGLHAGKLVKEVATVCGGGGGGRPDMAQAGGKDASKLDEALKVAGQWITSQFDLFNSIFRGVKHLKISLCNSRYDIVEWLRGN